MSLRGARLLRRLETAVSSRPGLLLVLAAVGLSAYLTVQAVAAVRRHQGLDSVFVSGVLLLVVVLILVCLFVLGRYLIKLYLEHGGNRTGSRYRTKVVALVVGLTLLPSLALFVTAGGIVRAALEQPFEPDREAILRDGKQLVDRYEALEEARGLSAARDVARALAGEGVADGKGRRSLLARLEQRRVEEGVEALRVYDARGRLLAHTQAPEASPELRGAALPARPLADLLGGARDTLRFVEAGERGLRLFLGVPLRDAQALRGAVVAVVEVSGDPAQALARLSGQFEEYEQAKANRERIQQGFLLVLTLFTLLLLIAAVWVGSSLAKTMTVPIQRLADATRAVSEGRFDFRVEVEAPDELGVLVRSFNRMLEELRLGRVKVERSTFDLQRSNSELVGRRAYIETLLENIPAGVVSLDSAGRVNNLNHAAIRMFGFTERPAIGVHFRELFASKEFLELRILIEKVMGIRELNLVRELHLRLGRRMVDLAVNFTALAGPRGEDLGLILVLDDLSNLIKAQKVAAWREVARRIAHEIKNPLTPIQLSAQRIQKKWREGDEEIGQVIEECTETITAEVDGLKTLVNEFSRFARMPPVAPAPSQLDKILNSSLVLYEGLHPGIRLERNISSEMPTLDLDAEQMKRLLINLVDNAIEAQEGVGRVAVTGYYDPRSQSARIIVADEGPGIPPEDRERLFVPYFSTKKSGTGLGLAIVHRIVSDHNGTIRIEDNTPRGARFVVEIPG